MIIQHLLQHLLGDLFKAIFSRKEKQIKITCGDCGVTKWVPVSAQSRIKEIEIYSGMTAVFRKPLSSEPPCFLCKSCYESEFKEDFLGEQRYK